MHPLKKQNIFFAITGLLLVLFISSCSKPKSQLAQYGPFFENVMRSDAGVFRGFSLGAPFDSVQHHEPKKPIESDPNYLYYEYSVDSIGSFNITYSFNEGRLTEIQSDFFINQPATTEIIFNSFKMYLDEHYGSAQTSMGFSVWSVKSELFGDIKINLSNESSDFSVDKSPGKVSLWIYPDKQ